MPGGGGTGGQAREAASVPQRVSFQTPKIPLENKGVRIRKVSLLDDGVEYDPAHASTGEQNPVTQLSARQMWHRQVGVSINIFPCSQ